MSASKVAKPSHQRPSRRDTLNQSENQDDNQVPMAMAAGPRSLQTDAVPCPEDPPPVKEGYRKEIFDKKEEQDKFSCGYCSKILREPVQANCGHRFCQNCQKTIEEKTTERNKVFCKFCKEEGAPDDDSVLDPKEMFPDRGIKREMGNLHAKCPNDLCIWQGRFKEYIKHEEECKHQPMVCDKCRQLVSKQKLDQHKTQDCPQRVIKCDHCTADIVFTQKKSHIKECPKFPESCSQCSRQVPRDKMRKHQSQDCPNRMVTCPIEGCGTQQQQNRFQQHVQKDQPKHLAWVLSRINDIDEAISALTNPSGASGRAVGQGSEMMESVETLKRKVEELERQVQAYGQQAGVSAAGGTTGGVGGGVLGQGSGEAQAGMEDSSTDRIIAMEFKVNSLEPILSVLHGEMNRCIGAIEAVEARHVQEARKAEEVRQKIQQYESTINTMSASLNQREAKLREMEARIISLGHDKPDGSLMWRIPNFSQVRKDAMTGTVTNIHSRPFYSGPMGYKMCVRLYPNGDGLGKGTHLSLFFSLMRSTNDALLQWPFKQKVYFMLIDQNFKKHVVDAFRSEPSSSSFQRPTSEMNIATGCPLFMQLNKLHQAGHGYLKDDSMFIRVVVETEGLDDHLKQLDPRTIPPQS